jgi:hypothetical protein
MMKTQGLDRNTRKGDTASWENEQGYGLIMTIEDAIHSPITIFTQSMMAGSKVQVFPYRAPQ